MGGRGNSVEIWPLRKPVKKEEFLERNLKVPKKKIKEIPGVVWIEMEPVSLSSDDQLERVWEIFKAFEEYRKEKGLILLARKDDNWLGEKEVEFFVARPVGIDEDFLKKKKLFLIPDEKILKVLKNL